MISIVILTHGLFGDELFHAAEMIVGKQDKVYILSIHDGFSIDEIASQLSDILTINDNNGTLIFTDMFGGSPSNISMGFLTTHKCEIVSGVNLPMMLKALSSRNNKKITLSEIATDVATTAKDSIKIAGMILNKDNK